MYKDSIRLLTYTVAACDSWTTDSVETSTLIDYLAKQPVFHFAGSGIQRLCFI